MKNTDNNAASQSQSNAVEAQLQEAQAQEEALEQEKSKKKPQKKNAVQRAWDATGGKVIQGWNDANKARDDIINSNTSAIKGKVENCQQVDPTFSHPACERYKNSPHRKKSSDKELGDALDGANIDALLFDANPTDISQGHESQTNVPKSVEASGMAR